MEIALRPANPSDAAACGQVSFAAFAAIAQLHNFPCDVASAQEASSQFTAWIADPGRWVLVAESAGRVVGSIVLDERGPIVGVGPVTVDPSAQDQRVGRQLMQAALERSAGSLGSRLVQAAYHRRSLALYNRLGFDAREPLVCLSGTLPALDVPGRTVRPATHADLSAANELCCSVHGHDRNGELRAAIFSATATVVIHNGRLTGYATEIGFSGHAVAATHDDLLALIAAARRITGQGFLLPARNNPMLRRLLAMGLRIQQPLTLMTLGHYQEPVGAYLPSISY